MSEMTQDRNGPMRLLAEIDARLYVWLGLFAQRYRIYRFARTVSFTGDGYAYLLLAALMLLLSPQYGVAVTLAAFLAFAFELPAYVLLKKTFRRRRPYVVHDRYERIHIPSDEFSFPSGHTAGGFVMATVVSHFFPATALAMYAWATAIGFSRILLRVHFVSDVVAGALLGVGFAALALNLLGY